jgi:hypothetical protein
MRAALALALVGCAASPLGGPRFHNAPAVAIVDDRREVSTTPQPRDPNLWLYHFDNMFLRELTRPLELRRSRRALGVNAVDEVPDSTWFTNRIGVHVLSAAEIRRGPVTVGSPEPHKPWTIKSSKSGGRSVGFVIEDARGEKFLLKFDPAGYPEAETAAGVITNRLLWAFGYNVPEDCIVHLRREDLVLSPKATTRDSLGRKQPLDRDELDRQLAKIEVGADGAIRALTSQIVAGNWLGGHPGEGKRDDDPNDRIPHELRRDLRGQYAVFAWLDHVDVKEHNTLDMWVTDRADPARHYVRHYLIDFGKSLGFMATTKPDPRIGFSYGVDYGELFGSLVSAGLWSRPWETRSAPELRGVGAYDAGSFDPAAWKPATQVYLPVRMADRFDSFWSAKILMRFTRDQLRAAVTAGELTDPRAADYLVDTLVARQRATGAYWFRQVNPLDRFAISPLRDGQALCFDDLALAHGLATPLATRYTLTRYDRAGRRLGEPIALRPGATARTCPPITLADVGEGYTIVELATTRPGFTGETLIHVARDPISRAARVIGVWRQ